MPRVSPLLLTVLLAGVASGCYVPVPETVYSRCDALGSANWTARFERRPNHKGRLKRNVFVSGTVSLPSAGYVVALERGPVSRTEPRALQVLLRTTAPAEPAAQAVTSYRVEGFVRADETIGEIAIRCGDGILAEIRQIEVEPAD